MCQSQRCEVDCVIRGKEHEYIEYIGGPWGRMSVDDAIVAIENGKEFFVRIDGNEVIIRVAGGIDNRFLRTDADGFRGDNLDWLPICDKH